MPSRARNRRDTLTALRRLYFYRFEVFLEDSRNSRREIEPGAWAHTALMTGTKVEEITETFKRKRDYRDINIWPVEREVWNAFIEKRLSHSEQRIHNLI